MHRLVLHTRPSEVWRAQFHPPHVGQAVCFQVISTRTSKSGQGIQPALCSHPPAQLGPTWPPAPGPFPRGWVCWASCGSCTSSAVAVPPMQAELANRDQIREAADRRPRGRTRRKASEPVASFDHVGLTYLARCCPKLQRLTVLGGNSSAASSLLMQARRVRWP